MSLVTTTNSSAVSATDSFIVVASATSIVPGRVISMGAERMRVTKAYVSGTTIPVLRGQDGTLAQAHGVTTNVVHGDAVDFEDNPPGFSQGVPLALSLARDEYGAAGAISFGRSVLTVALINGTSALAMTLANPTKDQDGQILIIVGNGKAAHTVTYTAGLGNAGSGYDVGTFDTGGQCSVMLIAANGIWVPLPSPLSGTLTAIDVAVA